MITLTPSTNIQLNVPPPPLPNLSVPPPMHRFNAPPPQRFSNHYQQRHNFFQPFRPYGTYGRGLGPLDPEFDGKRLRKSAMRKTVDYNAAIIKMLEGRVWQRDWRDRRSLQPDTLYLPDILPPPSYEENATNAVTTRFVKTATNKMRCPVFCMAWTPEGRRLVTGASSGEFTLWNGLTFNFETILQAHDSPVRTMVWSHNDLWMVTADHAGFVKYWQSNMNNVKMFLAHKEAIRGISFSPTDNKFATCSDDGTIRIWDFLRCQEERVLRGHGADVKCIHWHPQKGLLVSGSKDNQQPVKLWDPKTGQSLATLHAHKSTVMDIKWNNNGNWIVTASRDHLLKLFDLRNLSSEVQTFRGHKKESSSVAWHPYHEGLFCSGGSDGSILFWHVGADKEVGAIEQAHDSIVWTLAWHPLGHILCSGSNDHTSKFWTRNRPGDQMRDKYNLNTLPTNLSGFDENDIDDMSMIPGMGPEDKVEVGPTTDPTTGTIPGLDIDVTDDKNKFASKKVPYSKPIPKNFQAQWNETGKLDDSQDEERTIDHVALLTHILEQTPGVKSVEELEPEALLIYGKLLKVTSGSKLYEAIRGGQEKLLKYVNSTRIPQLYDVKPYIDISGEEDNVDDSDGGEEHMELDNSILWEDPRHASDMQWDQEDGNDMDLRDTFPDHMAPHSHPDTQNRNYAGTPHSIGESLQGQMGSRPPLLARPSHGGPQGPREERHHDHGDEMEERVPYQGTGDLQGQTGPYQGAKDPSIGQRGSFQGPAEYQSQRGPFKSAGDYMGDQRASYQRLGEQHGTRGSYHNSGERTGPRRPYHAPGEEVGDERGIYQGPGELNSQRGLFHGSGEQMGSRGLYHKELGHEGESYHGSSEQKGPRMTFHGKGEELGEGRGPFHVAAGELKGLRGPYHGPDEELGDGRGSFHSSGGEKGTRGSFHGPGDELEGGRGSFHGVGDQKGPRGSYQGSGEGLGVRRPDFHISGDQKGLRDSYNDTAEELGVGRGIFHGPGEQKGTRGTYHSSGKELVDERVSFRASVEPKGPTRGPYHGPGDDLGSERGLRGHDSGGLPFQRGPPNREQLPSLMNQDISLPTLKPDMHNFRRPEEKNEEYEIREGNRFHRLPTTGPPPPPHWNQFQNTYDRHSKNEHEHDEYQDDEEEHYGNGGEGWAKESGGMRKELSYPRARGDGRGRSRFPRRGGFRSSRGDRGKTPIRGVRSRGRGVRGGATLRGGRRPRSRAR